MIKIRRNFKGSGGKPQRTKEGEKQRNFFYLRKFRKLKNQVAKMRVNLRKNLQVEKPSCKNFRSYETPSRHTCAISHLQKPILQLRTKLQNPQSKILQVQSSSCENFRNCKTPSRHTCAILHSQNPILLLRNKL